MTQQRRWENAREAERQRARPYRVMVDTEDGPLVFGESDRSDGGAAMYLARLVRWGWNALVEEKS